jgi:pimeloyl-ACP methyl ester carboxylesterase
MNPVATTLVSPDGAQLRYQTLGHGPGLIVLPGALAEAADFAAFARELAPRFTVHVLDRRGHGASDPQCADYRIEQERDDVLALQAQTQSRYLFGHSFGGLVALEAAHANPRFAHVAVYEPGVSIDGSVPIGWALQAQAQLARGEEFDAFVTFARGVNPESAGKLPRWAFKLILRAAMRAPERAQKGRLLGAAIREHAEAARLDNSYAAYREIPADVLLMIGGRGPTTATAAATAAALAGVIPRARVVPLPRLDHFGPEHHPADVARLLLDAVGRAQH